MSNDEPPREADVDAINNDLSDGLKSCRKVVSNYRAILGAETNENAAEGEAASDREAPTDRQAKPEVSGDQR